jgi:hypothetical protein
MKKAMIILTIFILTLTAFQVAHAKDANLPGSIQDPLLLHAWTLLNNLEEPIHLPDGETLTGHGLAQFVLDKEIPIVWDEKNVCGGNSCSVRYCLGTTCSHQDSDLPGVQPIYLRLALKTGAENLLVESMAHEIYHYTEPFGQVDDSLFEEYLAFYGSARIAHTRGMDDASQAPMQPDCLKGWFENHFLMYGYTQVQVYPPSLMASVDTTSQTCSRVEKAAQQPTPDIQITQQPEQDYTLICQANSLGLIVCQKETATGAPSTH